MPTPILYKLMSAEHAKSSICQKRLKVSLVPELNDPYEWVPAVVDGSGAPIFDAEKVRTKMYAGIRGKHGMICMTSAIDDSVMWSHYGDKHKGVALAFSFPEPSGVIKVKYSNDRVVIDLQNNGEPGPILDGHFEQLLGHKSAGWSYEKEYRFIVPVNPATEQDGHYWKELSDDIFTGVVLGCLCPDTEDQMLQFLKDHGFDNVAVSRARMNPKEFKMNLQQEPPRDAVPAARPPRP
jgi:hypothetical protein